ncbi:hypothetical protein P9112_012823 [Eukaryota sp. TZLM1-RC]
MQVKIKFLSPSRIVDVDVSPDELIKTLKTKTMEQINADPKDSSLRLVHKGRVLKDDESVSNSFITESDCLIAVLQKTPKPQQPPSEPKPSSTPAQQPSSTPTSTPSTSQAQPTQSVESAPSQETAFPEVTAPPPSRPQMPSGVPPAFNLGDLQQAASLQQPQQPQQQQQPSQPVEVDQSSLDFLKDMGFEEQISRQALSLSNNDVARAVELIESGIDLSSQPQPHQQQQQSAAGMQGNPLMGLTQVPGWSQLRQRILSDPNALREFITQLAQSNPQLAMYIQQNPQALAQVLSQDVGDGGSGQQVLRLSEEEMEAVQRIEGITGAPRAVVAQAYMAMDKNEEAAINFIYDTMEDWKEE